MPSLSDALALILCLLGSLLAALPGAIFRPGAWYQRLNKPAWRPPDRLFGPVWLVLYVLMALAAWRVWRRPETEGTELALGVYGVQLVLNGLWTVVFFGLRRPGLALVEITGLWLAVALTIVLFQRIDVWAAYLLVPYLLWVSFAVALNHAVWRLNPGRVSSP